MNPVTSNGMTAGSVGWGFCVGTNGGSSTGTPPGFAAFASGAITSSAAKERRHSRSRFVPIGRGRNRFRFSRFRFILVLSILHLSFGLACFGLFQRQSRVERRDRREVRSRPPTRSYGRDDHDVVDGSAGGAVLLVCQFGVRMTVRNRQRRMIERRFLPTCALVGQRLEKRYDGRFVVRRKVQRLDGRGAIGRIDSESRGVGKGRAGAVAAAAIEVHDLFE